MPLPTLPNRVTALDVTLLSFGSQDLIGSWKTFEHSFDIGAEDGKASNSRYAKNQATRRKRSFSITVFHDSGTRRATTLDLSAWTVGGSSRLGDIKNATLTITTKTAEGSGAKDLDLYPVAVATEMEIQAEEFVSADADLIALASLTSDIADFELTVTLTIAGLTFTAPMLLSSGSHKIDGEEIQLQNVTFKLRGTISSPAVGVLTGAPRLLALIATGTAAIQYSINKNGDADTEIGYALITKATVTIQDSGIIEDQFEFETQGQSAAS